MKSVVLVLFAFVFTSTVAHAAPPVEKPFSHYVASATANTFNRIKTVDNYTKWIANRVPPDQMKDFKAYLKENGIAASTQFPKLKAKDNSVCTVATKECFVMSDDSVTFGGATFKVEKKPFRQVVEGACEKLGCSNKTASYNLIPKAHAARSKGENALLWGVIGGLAGYALAEPLGTDPLKTAVVGAAVGGFGGYMTSSERKHHCRGRCEAQWEPSACRYAVTYPQPAPADIYQQQPPPYMPPQEYHHSYGQPQPPCDANPYPRPEPVEYALNSPPRPQHCSYENPYCGGNFAAYQPPRGQPADVRALPDDPNRYIQSEDKKK